MKKLKSTIPTGGAPLGEFPVFRELFTAEVFDSIEAVLNSVYDGEIEGGILSGCKVTGAGPYDISAGLVYLDGEILRFDAVTGQTLPKYIAKAAVTSEGGTFGDGNTKDYIDVNKAELVASAPGTGQYITIPTTGGSTLKKKIGDTINTGAVTDAKLAKLKMTVGAMTAQLSTRVISIGSWNMDVTTSTSVAHDLVDHTKIRSISVIIKNDAGTVYTSLVGGISTNSGGVIENIGSTFIDLAITATGDFDSADYSSSPNRGWITIIFEGS